MMTYDGWQMIGWGGGLMMIIFWVALLALVVWLARAVFPTPRQGNDDRALDLLRRRYAAGEITQDEYEQVRRTLGGDVTAVPGAGRS